MKRRCEGKRRQLRNGVFGTFKCGRQATGTVTTNVGFSETHHVCGDDSCYRFIASGYPAQYTPYSS